MVVVIYQYESISIQRVQHNDNNITFVQEPFLSLCLYVCLQTHISAAWQETETFPRKILLLKITIMLLFILSSELFHMFPPGRAHGASYIWPLMSDARPGLVNTH